MSRRGVIATALFGVLVVLALLLAASSAPVAIVSRPLNTDTGSRQVVTPFATTTTTTTPSPTDTSPDDAGSGLAGLFGVLIAVIVIAVLLLVVSIAFAFARRAFRRPIVTSHPESSFWSPPVPDELLATAASRLLLLETGEPRNAIVAAWLDLERAAGETGLPRERAETSTEYTARVIGTWEVDRERLDDLAALYREARFSVHELDEHHRRRAIGDLLVLHQDLENVGRRQRAADRSGPALPSPPGASS